LASCRPEGHEIADDSGDDEDVEQDPHAPSKQTPTDSDCLAGVEVAYRNAKYAIAWRLTASSAIEEREVDRLSTEVCDEKPHARKTMTRPNALHIGDENRVWHVDHDDIDEE
jgi:hypothetical protein